MADYSPIYGGGNLSFTATTSGVVTGGQMLAVSGTGTVAAAGAASGTVVGVAGHDAASGATVTVLQLAGVVHEFLAGVGDIAAGDLVKVGASANVVIAIASGTFDTRVGIALTTATATNKCKVLGR